MLIFILGSGTYMSVLQTRFKTRRRMNVFLLQVTTLVSSKSAQKQRKGRSKRAHVLVAAVEKATENFVEKGEIIAAENPEIR
jgi:catenin alpha